MELKKKGNVVEEDGMAYHIKHHCRFENKEGKCIKITVTEDAISIPRVLFGREFRDFDSATMKEWRYIFKPEWYVASKGTCNDISALYVLRG
eukprot:g47321.t1